MSSRRPFVATSLVLVSALALAGCASASADADPETSENEAGTITYTWDRNVAGEDEEPTYEETTVEVPKNPEKIVAFEMSSLDSIGALGGEVAGAPLESVPEYLKDNLADDAFNAGTLFEADLIEIEAQQPDLIIIGGRSSGLYDELSEIAPTIDLGISDTYLNTLERNTEFFGELLGAEDEASALLDELNAGIDEAKAATADAGNGLAVMVSGGELKAMSPAPAEGGSAQVRGGLLYDVFGVEPAIDDIKAATHGDPISFEFLLEHDPETLWVVDRDAATGSAEDGMAAAQVLDNDIVEQTAAFTNDKIVYLNPTAWYIVYGGLETTQLMIDDVLQITE
ncbi:siderophore ABC transporter substrate-binding protein [Microbacterium sp.]|uniref:siderophore ABC transporter substrate-binding protein n=1 Tax=Microbacterium sp. TaxID=51671 RepID=UPI002637F70A|nr:siderophore ABC transporter substrate-binding protein [Microbacterium sp.]